VVGPAPPHAVKKNRPHTEITVERMAGNYRGLLRATREKEM